MNNEPFDFSGWATRANLKCSDGRTILKDAFKINDGQTVPLVWDHIHNQPDAVLGHAVLENREEGVYAYCSFNDTENGKLAKTLVTHGDVAALSIFANQLKQRGSDVMHGNIREVSLVLAGANPGASIQSVVKHGDDGTDTEDPEQGVIYTGETIELAHSGTEAGADTTEKPDDETVEDVFNSMSDKQKTVVYAIIANALNTDGPENKEDKDNPENKKEDKVVKHNVFDKDTEKTKEDLEKGNGDTLTHSEEKQVIADIKRYGSFRESCEAHDVKYIPTLAHSIDNVETLFPDAKTVTATPEFIKRKTGWVSKVMGAVHRTPFSHIKSIFADITQDEARARGYIKGNLKIDEVFSLLKRTTAPTTVYKKQSMNRDDIVDIVDFDAMAWLRVEMRDMLDEELARACLIGDGRTSASDDKINEQSIRPIWTDSELFTINKVITVAADSTANAQAKAVIRGSIEAFEDYEGSGEPTLYIAPNALTNMLLLEDTTGRVIYDTVAKLATALQVNEIVTVPVMKNLTRTVNSQTRTLAGIIVNLNDYNVGADKGGIVS